MAKIYDLIESRDGFSMRPSEGFYTEDFFRGKGKMYLVDHIVDDGIKTVHRYRLRSGRAMSFADAVEYDIKCPRCGNNLHLCDGPYDRTTHGLYKCRVCDRKTK